MWIAVAIAAVATVGLIARRILRSNGSVESRELLALAYELFSLGRTEGRAALEAHAANWKASPIFCDHPSIAANGEIRTHLVDALLLLVDDVSAEDLDQLLRASSRLARARRTLDRGAARHRDQMFACVRRSVLAIRRGASPVTAVRTGRAQLASNDQPSTTAITKIPEMRTIA